MPSQILLDVVKIHNDDPNFPFPVLEKIRGFIGMGSLSNKARVCFLSLSH